MKNLHRRVLSVSLGILGSSIAVMTGAFTLVILGAFGAAKAIDDSLTKKTENACSPPRSPKKEKKS